VVDSARLGGRFSGTGERSFEDLITLSALMSADRWTRLHTSS
jgi:hypothetical protein